MRYLSRILLALIVAAVALLGVGVPSWGNAEEPRDIGVGLVPVGTGGVASVADGFAARGAAADTYVKGQGGEIIGGWVSGIGQDMAQGFVNALGAALTAGGATVVLLQGRESAPGDGYLDMTSPDLSSGPVQSAVTLTNTMDRDAEAFVQVECIDSSNSVTTQDVTWPSGAITGFANSGYPYIAPGTWNVDPCGPLGERVAGVRIARAVYHNYGGWTGWGGVGRETVTAQAPGDYLNYRTSVVTRTCSHVSGGTDWVDDSTSTTSTAHIGLTWTASAPACGGSDTMTREDVTEGLAGGWQNPVFTWDITQGPKWCSVAGLSTCGMSVHLLNSDGSDLLCSVGVSRCADWITDPTASCYWGVLLMSSPGMCWLLRDQWKVDAVPDGSGRGVWVVPDPSTQTAVVTNSASVSATATGSPSASSSSSVSASSSPSTSPDPSSTSTSTSTATTTTTTAPTSTATSTPTSTSTATTSPTPPGDPGSDVCPGLGWSLSGLLNGSLVTNAVGCALSWAFVPSTADSEALVTSTRAGLTSTSVGQRVNDLSTPIDALGTAIGDGSCVVPTYTVEWLGTLHPFNFCSGLGATVAGWSRAFLGFSICIWLFLRLVKGVLRPWGFLKREDDGQ